MLCPYDRAEQDLTRSGCAAGAGPALMPKHDQVTHTNESSTGVLLKLLSIQTLMHPNNQVFKFFFFNSLRILAKSCFVFH